MNTPHVVASDFSGALDLNGRIFVFQVVPVDTRCGIIVLEVVGNHVRPILDYTGRYAHPVDACQEAVRFICTLA